jgi:type I restriction enzyme M protein
VARYFADQQAAIETQQAALDAATASLAELEEEHGGEEGFLGSLDKIAKAEITARLKEIKGDKEAKDEAKVLQQWLKLNTEETELKRAIREAEAQLDLRKVSSAQRGRGKVLGGGRQVAICDSDQCAK